MKFDALFQGQFSYLIAVNVMPVLHRERQSGMCSQVAFCALAKLIQNGHMVGLEQSFSLTGDDAARSAVAGVMSSLGAYRKSAGGGSAKRPASTHTRPPLTPTIQALGACMRIYADKPHAADTVARPPRAQRRGSLKPTSPAYAAWNSASSRHFPAHRAQATLAEQPDEIQTLIRTGVLTMYINGEATKKNLATYLRQEMLRLNRSRPAARSLKIPSAKLLCCFIDEYLDLFYSRGSALGEIKRLDSTRVKLLEEKDKT